MMLQQFFATELSPRQRIRWLKRIFNQEWPKQTESREFLQTIQQLLEKYQYRIKIPQLARAMGCSERTLRRNFKDQIGISPKEYSKIYRLYKVVEHMEQPVCNNVATLSYDFGYYDQPHFDREFKDYLKVSPSEFLKIYTN